MASNQLQNQLTRFISRGRNRRKPAGGYRPVKQGQVTPFKPVKRSRKGY
jgi:hypothetical protein